MYIGDIKVTKREAITSLVIIFVLLFVGFFISNAIADKVADTNAAYYTAVKINNDPVQFEYGMRTNIGNALVHGDLKTVDPVTMSGLLNDYMYVEKVYEKYTMHTRTITHTDGKGHTYTTVQTYYTWDYHGHDVTKASTVNFLGVDFPIEKFALDWHTTLNLNTETADNTILNISQGNYCYPDGFWESVGDIRYHYNVIPKTSTGSIFVRLADEDITPVFSKKIELIKKTPAEIVEDKQDSENIPIIIFWVLWSIGIIVLVVIYVARENDWLEVRKNRRW